MRGSHTEPREEGQGLVMNLTPRSQRRGPRPEPPLAAAGRRVLPEPSGSLTADCILTLGFWPAAEETAAPASPRLFRQPAPERGVVAAAAAAAGTDPPASLPVPAGSSSRVCDVICTLVIGEAEQLSLCLLGEGFIIFSWFPIRVFCHFSFGLSGH